MIYDFRFTILDLAYFVNLLQIDKVYMAFFSNFDNLKKDGRSKIILPLQQWKSYYC